MNCKPTKENFAELLKAGRFAIVGVANTLLDMGVFALLAQLLGWNVYLSQVVSYSVGTLNSYIWNRSWTFGSSQRFWSPALVKFLLLSVAMLLLSTGLLWLFYDQLGLHKLVAKGASVIITMVVNFVINRLWVFRS
ncbi:MAG: GtrA family protein [Angelakisella sp.]